MPIGTKVKDLLPVFELWSGLLLPVRFFDRHILQLQPCWTQGWVLINNTKLIINSAPSASILYSFVFWERQHRRRPFWVRLKFRTLYTLDVRGRGRATVAQCHSTTGAGPVDICVHDSRESWMRRGTWGWWKHHEAFLGTVPTRTVGSLHPKVPWCAARDQRLFSTFIPSKETDTHKHSAYTLVHWFFYSTSPLIRNRLNRNHLDQSLNSSKKQTIVCYSLYFRA